MADELLQPSPASAPAREVEVERLDPAQQSLADALRVSFGILKLAMLLVLVIYLFSNVFSVEPNEEAQRLRFGRVVKTLPEGGPYWAWPFPIEQVVKTDVSRRRVTLDKSFWLSSEQARLDREARRQRGGVLDPTTDGFLLTGDGSIMHGRFTVAYRITDPEQFVTHIGTLARADEIVAAVAEQGVVHAVAQLPAEELHKSRLNSETAQRVMQQALEALEAGITIEEVTLTERTVPNRVLAAFDAVGAAEAERAQAVLDAQQERARILAETAGEGAEALLGLIETYEALSETGSEQEIAQAAAAIDQALISLRVGEMDRTLGGQVANAINQARTYRTQVTEQLKSEYDLFAKLLPEYRRNPRLIVSRMWEQAKQEALTSKGIETFYLPPSQMTLVLSRDPKLQEEIAKERIKQIDRTRVDIRTDEEIAEMTQQNR